MTYRNNMKDRKLGTSDLDLTGVHPSRWPEIRRRIEVIESYLKLANPTIVDEAEHAHLLHLNLAHFRRLVAAWISHRDPAQMPAAQPKTGKSQKGSKLSPEVEVIVAAAFEQAAPKPSASSIWINVVNQCETLGLPAPSRNAIWLRLNKMAKPATSDEDIFIDHCMINLPIEDTFNLPWLSLIGTCSGHILAHHVGMAEPSPHIVALLLSAALDRHPTTGDLVKIAFDISPDERWQPLPSMLKHAGADVEVTIKEPYMIGKRISAAIGKDLGGLSLRLQRLAKNQRPKFRENKFLKVTHSDLPEIVKAAIDKHNSKTNYSDRHPFIDMNHQQHLIEDLKTFNESQRLA